MVRGSIHKYYIEMLEMVEKRSTCQRRKVGAVITTIDGKILGTGYNGVPKRYPHCIDKACPGVLDASGDTSNCVAVHAEQNAIINCADLSRAYYLYCTCLPCFICSKMILNTNIQVVVYKLPYSDSRGLMLADTVGKKFLHYPADIA